MEQKQRSNSGQKPRSANRRRRRRSTSTPGESLAVANRRRPAPAAGRTQTRDPATGAGDAGEHRAATLEVGAHGATEPARDPAGAVPSAPATVRPTASDASAGAEFTCPVCSRAVHDLYTAIAYGDGMVPAHFDCILSLLGEREQFSSGERLCYLGGGSFGIVQTRPAHGKRNGNDGGLFIRKRIEFEEKDAAPEWRQELWITTRPRLVAAVTKL